MSVTLTKGANCSLPVTRVVVEVSAAVPVDVSALLLARSEKVRSDADFVFYNQPSGPGVRFEPGGGGRAPAVHVDLEAVPADVHTVVIALSLDTAGGRGPVTFGGVAPPTATVRDIGGEALVTFTPHGLGLETALVFLELYRRAGAWKVRAVGQGYANGLAGIATDFGVTVDDTPTQTSTRTPAPSPTPTRPEPIPAPIPAPVSTPTPVPNPPQPYGGWAQASVEPVTHTPPPVPRRPAVGQPPTPSKPVAPFPVGQPAGAVNLDKGRVSLRKNESVSLVKSGAPPLTRVRMGLGWDPAKRGGSIDLDASCIAFDAAGKKVATVWFMKLSGLGGAIQHSGDNLTGAGDGDDESIVVRLDAIPPNVAGLVFTVNSFLGQKFTEVSRAFCRLVDDTTDAELVHFELSDSEACTAVLMCKLVREGPHWRMTALGRFAEGRTVRKLVDPARDALRG